MNNRNVRRPHSGIESRQQDTNRPRVDDEFLAFLGDEFATAVEDELDFEGFEFNEAAAAAAMLAPPPNPPPAADDAAIALDVLSINNDADAAAIMGDDEAAPQPPLKSEESTDDLEDDTSDGDDLDITYNQFQEKEWCDDDKRTRPFFVFGANGSDLLFAGVDLLMFRKLLRVRTSSVSALPEAGRKIALSCKTDAGGNPITSVILRPQSPNSQEKVVFQGTTYTVEKGRVAIAICGNTLPVHFNDNWRSEWVSKCVTVKAKIGKGKSVIAVLPFTRWIKNVARVCQPGTITTEYSLGDFTFVSSNDRKKRTCELFVCKHERTHGGVRVTEIGADILPRGQHVTDDPNNRGTWSVKQIRGASCKNVSRFVLSFNMKITLTTTIDISICFFPSHSAQTSCYNTSSSLMLFWITSQATWKNWRYVLMRNTRPRKDILLVVREIENVPV